MRHNIKKGAFLAMQWEDPRIQVALELQKSLEEGNKRLRELLPLKIEKGELIEFPARIFSNENAA